MYIYIFICILVRLKTKTEKSMFVLKLCVEFFANKLITRTKTDILVVNTIRFQLPQLKTTPHTRIVGRKAEIEITL